MKNISKLIVSLFLLTILLSSCWSKDSTTWSDSAIEWLGNSWLDSSEWNSSKSWWANWANNWWTWSNVWWNSSWWNSSWWNWLSDEWFEKWWKYSMNIKICNDYISLYKKEVLERAPADQLDAIMESFYETIKQRKDAANKSKWKLQMIKVCKNAKTALEKYFK